MVEMLVASLALQLVVKMDAMRVDVMVVQLVVWLVDERVVL